MRLPKGQRPNFPTGHFCFWRQICHFRDFGPNLEFLEPCAILGRSIFHSVSQSRVSRGYLLSAENPDRSILIKIWCIHLWFADILDSLRQIFCRFPELIHHYPIQIPFLHFRIPNSSTEAQILRRFHRGHFFGLLDESPSFPISFWDQDSPEKVDFFPFSMLEFNFSILICFCFWFRHFPNSLNSCNSNHSLCHLMAFFYFPSEIDRPGALNLCFRLGGFNWKFAPGTFSSFVSLTG